MNTVSLAKDPFIRKGEGGGGGGVTINNQEKSLEITENGTTEVTADAGFTGLSKVVVNTNVQSGGAPVSKPVNDVNFYDYDGTILHSYTKDEFLALSAMPPLPEREGLICQEWNWDYEEAQEYVAEYGLCDIGATYITDDGATRLYIRIPHYGSLSQSFKMGFTGGTQAGSIDWGDGKVQAISSSSSKTYTHVYAEEGEYVIKIDPVDGNIISFMRGNSLNLYKAEVGKGVAGSDEFSVGGAANLESISLPKGFASPFRANATSIKCYVIPKNTPQLDLLTSCNALKHVALPNTPIQLKANVFDKCDALQRLVIPTGVTFVNPTNCISNCTGLNSLILPKEIATVPTIYSGSYAFTYLEINNGSVVLDKTVTYYPYNLKTIYFGRCEAVPQMQNTNVFTGLPSDCKIVVPDALYDEWIAATNWSTFASKIIKKSDWDASQS